MHDVNLGRLAGARRNVFGIITGSPSMALHEREVVRAAAGLAGRLESMLLELNGR